MCYPNPTDDFFKKILDFDCITTFGSSEAMSSDNIPIIGIINVAEYGVNSSKEDNFLRSNTKILTYFGTKDTLMKSEKTDNLDIKIIQELLNVPIDLHLKKTTVINIANCTKKKQKVINWTILSAPLQSLYEKFWKDDKIFELIVDVHYQSAYEEKTNRAIFPSERLFIEKPLDFEFNLSDQQLYLLKVHQNNIEYITSEGLRVMDQRNKSEKGFALREKKLQNYFYKNMDDKLKKAFSSCILADEKNKKTKHSLSQYFTMALNKLNRCPAIPASCIFPNDVNYKERVAYKNLEWNNIDSKFMAIKNAKNALNPNYIVVED